MLRQYSDEGAPTPDAQGEYEAGLVTIWREPAADADSHGTTIILTGIRPQTRDTLQSRDLWAAVDSDDDLAPSQARDLGPPTFHIGRVRTDDANVFQVDADVSYTSLPWSRGDRPEVAFGKLVKAVWKQVDQGTPNPQLERIFDYYLRMVWQLSLAIPAPYVLGNPFDLLLQDNLYLFEMPQSGRATGEFKLVGDETIRMKKPIGSAADVGSDFTVLVDDLRLARPLVFTDLPETSHAVKKSILVVGRCREEFDGVPLELTGGPLDVAGALTPHILARHGTHPIAPFPGFQERVTSDGEWAENQALARPAGSHNWCCASLQAG